MKVTSTQVERTGSVYLDFAENCDSDAFPFLSRIEIRGLDVELDKTAAALAGALLFSSYCGDVAEFPDTDLSVDALRALRGLLPSAVTVSAAVSRNRSISSGTRTLTVLPTLEGIHAVPPSSLDDTTRLVTWSGDFVDAVRRSSAGHIHGAIFTNAGLIADAFSVSLAIGLLAGGGNLREIRVLPPGSDKLPTLAAAQRSLELMGISIAEL